MMDDVWRNAWSQPEEDLVNNAPSKPNLDVSGWTLPTASKTEETDVGIPSWSSGELNWTEPTGQASLWSSAATVDNVAIETSGWRASSTKKIGFGSGSTENADRKGANALISLDAGKSSDTPASEKEFTRSSTPDSAGAVISPVEVDSSCTDHAPTPPADVSSPLDSPDPFGSFEMGLGSMPTALTGLSFDDGGQAWSSSMPAFDDPEEDGDAWVSAWESSAPEDRRDVNTKDEWAVAREEKLRRDRSVPPELLAAIIDRLNEVSAYLWTSKEKGFVEQNFGNWQDGMHNVDGLEELVSKVLPETTPHPPIRFPRSHTAKAMAKSIKMSKNLPIVRNSPMSQLFTAKTLSAWELSVKSKVDLPRDDVPAGWRAVEPEEKEETKPALVEKRTGSILSFWNRRMSAISPASTGTDSKKSSLIREVVASSPGSESGRTSTDAQSVSDKKQHSSSASSISSVFPSARPSSSSSSISTLPSSTASPVTSSLVRNQESPAAPATPLPPSAVSRFLNRFSHTRSDISPGSRSSIALSTDDIEFLSDIVPSHSDNVDEDEQSSALTALMSSSSILAKLPSALAPPPLAPPPRPISLSRPQTPHPQPLLPSVMVPMKPKPSDSFGDFEQLAPQLLLSKSTINGSSSTGVLTPVLLPPLLPPPSPTSMAGLSMSSTPSPLSGGIPSVATPSPRAWSPGISAPPPPKAHRPSSSISGLRSSSQCSVTASNGSSAVHAPLGSSPSSSLIKPPTSETRRTSGLSSQLQSSFYSSLIPPPIDKSPDRVYVHPTSKVFDDDDFSDFQDHLTSSTSLPLVQPYQDQVSISFDGSFDAPSYQSILPHHDTSLEDSFGDFGDFISINHASPSTKPMSLPKSALHPPAPPKKHVPTNIKTKHIRKLSSEIHQATAQLVERAAARQGRWPAPPSPVPDLLSPPPPGAGSVKTTKPNQSLLELDEYSGIDSPAVMPTPAISLKSIAQITSSATLRVAAPPLSRRTSPRLEQSGLSPSLLGFESLAHTTSSFTPSQGLPQPLQMHSTPSPKTRPSSTVSAKGGLSAQDLAFFDGL